MKDTRHVYRRRHLVEPKDGSLQQLSISCTLRAINANSIWWNSRQEFVVLGRLLCVVIAVEAHRKPLNGTTILNATSEKHTDL